MSVKLVQNAIVVNRCRLDANEQVDRDQGVIEEDISLVAAICEDALRLARDGTNRAFDIVTSHGAIASVDDGVVGELVVRRKTTPLVVLVCLSAWWLRPVDDHPDYSGQSLSACS